jgi:hypothetical protein
VGTYEIDAETESPMKVTGIGALVLDVVAAAVDAATRHANARAARWNLTIRE